ncbi:MAG: hypothetical protein JWM80_3 [Cyanobacteria bacterium RYN_339]|nr:hypothetical protein [Cyanobacteria bacterium RYN_339]
MEVVKPCRGRRRGNLVVTAFFIVLGLGVITAGIETMLGEQIRQASDIQSIGLAKLQCYYLAEMGLNHVMFEGNKNPTTNPDTFPVSTAAGQGTRFDFKTNVELVRNNVNGQAYCTVIRKVTNPNNVTFQVQAHLVTTAGTFDRVIEFVTQKKAGTGQPWVMAGYSVIQ